MLKKDWKTLLISSIVFIITFFSFNLHVISRVTTKWIVLMAFCSFVPFLIPFRKRNQKRFDVFFLTVLLFAVLILLKSFSTNLLASRLWQIISFIALYCFFYFNKISNIIFYHSFLIIAFILSFWGIFQFLYGYEFVVGDFDNPAGYSLSLVLLFPFVFYLGKIFKDKTKINWIYFGVCALIILAVLLCQSRTAIISLILMLIFFVRGKYKYILYCFAGILFFILLFGIKFESTTGRCFILQVSASMLDINKILFGYGFDGFQKFYMEYQANYFQNHFAGEYGFLADNIIHPLNEYLYFLIQHGIIFLAFGGVLLVVFFLKISRYSPHFLCAIAILVYSTFSYPFHYPITTLILAYILSSCRLKHIVIIKIKPYIYLFLCFLGVFWLNLIIIDFSRMNVWSRAFNKVKLGQFDKAKKDYDALVPSMNKNADFMFNYSAILCQYGFYQRSLDLAKQCRRLINNYDIQLLLADNYSQLNEYNMALYHYNKASLMCPNRFIPLYGMFIVYKKMGDGSRMKEYGCKIIDKPIKVKSRTVLNILTEVRKCLDSLEYNYQNRCTIP